MFLRRVFFQVVSIKIASLPPWSCPINSQAIRKKNKKMNNLTPNKIKLLSSFVFSCVNVFLFFMCSLPIPSLIFLVIWFCLLHFFDKEIKPLNIPDAPWKMSQLCEFFGIKISEKSEKSVLKGGEIHKSMFWNGYISLLKYGKTKKSLVIFHASGDVGIRSSVPLVVSFSKYSFSG